MHPIHPRAALTAVAGLLLAAAPALGQSVRDRLLGGLTLEAGAFAYGRERYANDTEVRFHAAAGWRAQLGRYFVEPHVALMTSLDGSRRGNGCGDGLCDPSGEASSELATVWPGVTAGLTFGDQRLSHSVGVRTAIGFEDGIKPLVGLRYEASARRAAMFVEGSYDRVDWARMEFDPAAPPALVPDGARWMPGLRAGGRFWFRPVTVPAPPMPGDAGVIPPQPEWKEP